MRDSQITSLPHKNSSWRRDLTVAWHEPLVASFLGENVPKEHTPNVLLAHFHPGMRPPKVHSRPPWHPAFLNCFYGVVMWFGNLSPKNQNQNQNQILKFNVALILAILGGVCLLIILIYPLFICPKIKTKKMYRKRISNHHFLDFVSIYKNVSAYERIFKCIAMFCLYTSSKLSRP